MIAQQRQCLIGLAVTAICATTAFSPAAEPPPSPPGQVQDNAEPYGSNTWVDPPTGARLLKVDLQNQRHVAGSWAAVGATIAAFHGKKSTPNDFCARAFGEKKCSVPKSQAAKLPRMQIGFQKSGIAAGRLSAKLTFAEVVKEIDAGRPLAVRVHWTVGGGHMLVLYGYNAKKQQVYWADPWPTADNYQWASMRYLLKNDLWHLTGAITGIGGGTPAPAHRRASSAPSGNVDSEPYGQSSFPAGAGGSSKLLRISQQVQRRDQWCWTASGSTIATYLGKRTAQEAFCNIARGRPAKARNCPNEPQPVTTDQKGFRKLGIRPGTVTPRAMSFKDIRTEVDKGRPAIAAIRWTGGGGHAVTIFGYDPRRKWVFWADPWGSSPRYNWARYSYFRKNKEFAMDHALKHIGAAPKPKKTVRH